MAFRLIELTVSRASAPRIEQILSECKVLGLWIHDLSESRALARILLKSSGTEQVLDLASGLIGVMVAVALVPPLTAAGLLLAAGEYTMATGAFLLLATNLICVNLAAVLTFLLQGIRPRTWWQADRAKRALRVAITLWLGLLLGLTIVILLGRR